MVSRDSSVGSNFMVSATKRHDGLTTTARRGAADRLKMTDNHHNETGCKQQLLLPSLMKRWQSSKSCIKVEPITRHAWVVS